MPFYLHSSTENTCIDSLEPGSRDIICEDFLLCIFGFRTEWCPSYRGQRYYPLPQWTCDGQGGLESSGMLCGRWGPAILSMVGHILNLLAKLFFWVGHVA